VLRRRLSGNIYSLLSLWAPEFYHWFHDVLPRLETALPHLPTDTRFLINPNPKAWQLDSLLAFGIALDRLEIQPNGAHTRVETLWFATPLGHSSLGSGLVIRRVADRLRRHFEGNESAQKSFHRVYISRAKATFRRVANENQITRSLKERGFEIVLCEELSLADQVRLFAAATAMVGAHGAGLTNLIYCTPNSLAGEIYVDGVPPVYLVLSQQLGMRFRRFKANTLEIERDQGEMYVNPAAFGRWLCDSLDQ
jgi:capsular polysaccharide biosynthesis protein